MASRGASAELIRGLPEAICVRIQDVRKRSEDRPRRGTDSDQGWHPPVCTRRGGKTLWSSTAPGELGWDLTHRIPMTKEGAAEVRLSWASRGISPNDVDFSRGIESHVHF